MAELQLYVVWRFGYRCGQGWVWIFLSTCGDEQGKDALEIRKGVASEIEYISMKILK